MKLKQYFRREREKQRTIGAIGKLSKKINKMNYCRKDKAELISWEKVHTKHSLRHIKIVRMAERLVGANAVGRELSDRKQDLTTIIVWTIFFHCKT